LEAERYDLSWLSPAKPKTEILRPNAIADTRRDAHASTIRFAFAYTLTLPSKKKEIQSFFALVVIWLGIVIRRL
jgi:hypothetical protein